MTSSQLQFWRNVCGCTVGSWTALLAIGWCIATPPLPAAVLWLRIAASGGIVVLAALVAKLLALAVARMVLTYHDSYQAN